ncbi:MAG: PH domain-containing protein [Deltaproteobacteria bacterium]|nr:PH domain-containing protein [Deltaproteobacteria bacterium]
MQPQSPNPQQPARPPAHAQPPAGSTAGPHSDVLYEGIARHSASLGGYIRWTFVLIAGTTIGILLQQIEFFASWPLWLIGLLALPGMLLVFLRHTTTRYKITLRRVEYEKGIITKNVESLELWRVLDVRYTQSLVDRMTGNGRITLIATDQSDPELLLYGLPEHRKLFEQLRDAVQAARQTSRPMELVGQEGFAENMGGGAWDG